MSEGKQYINYFVKFASFPKYEMFKHSFLNSFYTFLKHLLLLQIKK